MEDKNVWQRILAFWQGLLLKFLMFMANLYRADKPESNKRFWGSVGYVASGVFIAVWQHDLISQYMYLSASLIIGDKVIDALSKPKTVSTGPDKAE